jgi:hypothetical protein
MDLKNMPVIIQFNKRDLPNVRSEAELAKLAAQGNEPVYLAVATQGQGVVESFMGLLFLTWAHLNKQHDLARKFGFDSAQFMDQIAVKLGSNRSVPELVKSCVGGTAKAFGGAL